MGVVKKLKEDNVILTWIKTENGWKIEKDSVINGLWSRLNEVDYNLWVYKNTRW